MKLNEIFKSIKNIVLSLAVIGGLFFAYQYNENNKKIEVDSDLLMAKITESSELTTAKISYKGVFEYSGEGYNFINKTKFIMVYEAIGRVGIDIEQVRVSVDNENKMVYLKIPEASILEVNVDPLSIKYYNEQFKLFSFTEKEDANEAQALAAQEAKIELESMGVLENANNQAEILLKGILDNAIPDDYTFEVSFK